jgi:hypothetical protein
MSKTPEHILSHWNGLIEGLQASPMQFYAAVEEALERREIPDAKRSRVDWREGGIFSAKREYLRVSRFAHVVDICGAPFGKGFFVSWWGGEFRGCLASLTDTTFVGDFVKVVFKPTTYYQVDSAAMFWTAVDSAVKDVLDEMTKAQGIRALTEAERKPVMREFWQK